MPRQLIISVGLHKTGTTSIQKTCARNKRALLNAGFLYPEFSYQRYRYANHTGAFHYMFRREPEKIGHSGDTLWNSRAVATAIGDRLREITASQLLTQATSPLMVAEGASVLSVEELREMKRWFNDRGWSIRVICFVRWLSSWVNSMISQRVTGFQHLTIKSAVDEFLEVSGAIRPRVTNVREVFPDAEFYSYEAASRHRLGLVGFFFEAIGIGQMEKLAFERANEGRGDCATRLISSINEGFGPGFVDGKRNRRYMDHDISALNTIPGPRFSLRLDEVAPLLPLLRAENEWLKDTLGEPFHDPRLEFGDGPCVWAEGSLARLREILGTATPVLRSLASSYLASLADTDRAGTSTEGS